MNKTVTVDFELPYADIAQVSFSVDKVKFTTLKSGWDVDTVTLPIEVFYQMWNSDEMMNHMEDYNKRRQDNVTNP